MERNQLELENFMFILRRFLISKGLSSLIEARAFAFEKMINRLFATDCDDFAIFGLYPAREAQVSSESRDLLLSWR